MNNYRRYLWHSRYVIVYIDKIRSKGNWAIPQESDCEEAVEFENKENCDNYVKQLQECNLKYVVIDRERKKVLDNTINRDNMYENNTRADYQLLERYIGDNKVYEDFIDKKKYELYIQARNNNRYAKDYCFEAMSKYHKYLTDTWGKSKNKKTLPKLQVYDDPHMVKEEVDALKKEEKNKIKLITEKSGW